MVVMKTKVGGARAKEIIDRLPFDGAICTETIGFAGGLWLLWNSDRVEVEALANTEQEIHTEVKEATLWNKNHFDNIFFKKKIFLARLYGSQKALANNPRPSLFNLEIQLQKDLEEVLDQERDLWMLKSRLNWMIQGDRNTSFYHVSTLARRERNLIASVKDEGGVWITEEREVMDYFRRGFMNLYTTSQVETLWTPHPFRQWQVQFSDVVSQSLAAMVNLEEIKEALWSMQPYKAPGPYGLHAGFF
nr:uncharacterized protein LOC111991827 [Quercus suber]